MKYIWVNDELSIDTFNEKDKQLYQLMKTSVGAELSLDTVLAYAVPITVTVGSAWRHDGARQLPGGATVYFRVGRAF